MGIVKDVEEWNRKRRDFLSDEDMRIAVRIQIDRSGLSQNKWAVKYRVHPQSLSDWFCQRRPMPPPLKRHLGVIGVRVYLKQVVS